MQSLPNTHAVLAEFLKETQVDEKNIYAIYVTGSRAFGTNKPTSDYDLTIVVLKIFSMFLENNIWLWQIFDRFLINIEARED